MALTSAAPAWGVSMAPVPILPATRAKACSIRNRTLRRSAIQCFCAGCPWAGPFARQVNMGSSASRQTIRRLPGGLSTASLPERASPMPDSSSTTSMLFLTVHRRIRSTWCTSSSDSPIAERIRLTKHLRRMKKAASDQCVAAPIPVCV